MKKFSLRHDYSTIELVGPLEHLKISIDYSRNHKAVYSEAYWFMRFLNRHWDFSLDSIKSQVLTAIAKQSDKSAVPSRTPVSVIPDPPFSTDVLDPDTYQKLLNRLVSDLRDRFPQPSTRLRHAKLSGWATMFGCGRRRWPKSSSLVDAWRRFAAPGVRFVAGRQGFEGGRSRDRFLAELTLVWRSFTFPLAAMV